MIRIRGSMELNCISAMGQLSDILVMMRPYTISLKCYAWNSNVSNMILIDTATVCAVLSVTEIKTKLVCAVKLIEMFPVKMILSVCLPMILIWIDGIKCHACHVLSV